MMEVCVNNNSSTPAFEWSGCQPAQPSTARPKRDFRFQVIEVRQCPKWFIWPNRNRRNEEEVDENHNKETKTVGLENEYQQPNYSNQNQFATYSSTQNGYGAIRRNVLRGSKRLQMEKEGIPGRTASEPARRLSAKKDKATTEPISQGSPSNTFKILSIAKKWESFDATDDESDDVATSCAQLVIADTDRRWTAN
ncbi:hypothetical protein NECAME_16209 [Necator americanus]|uniref:Uncharacterized protein n=1 Tax=Necator americanus TaxID=51031 RepID=W2U032_NECAM|nr:hypothetical protein NECAME_16209 [Necator americanus]ETN86657.1 hypothetical protein NECAME_16209 [Necator americanus]